jgi:hypothetical protein
MEDENEYIELPDDPEAAFAALQRRKYKFLEQAWEDNRNWSFYCERQHVDTLLAFDEVHSLGILTEFRNPPNNDSKFSDFFQDFRRHAEIASQKIMMEAARRMKTGASTIVILDAAARSAIHTLIEKIREKLNELKLPESKRDALFNKLNSFAAWLGRSALATGSPKKRGPDQCAPVIFLAILVRDG